MKFNCGPSQAERERRERQAELAERRAQRSWHRWFAWRPIRIAEGDCRWLEYVERRDRSCWDGYANLPTWDFRSDAPLSTEVATPYTRWSQWEGERVYRDADWQYRSVT